jgi:hypothetical protein
MPHAKKVDQVAISPDGTQVAYIVDGQLTVTPIGGGALRAISLEDKLSLREVTWSTDSKQLAFLADLPGEMPKAQVWTVAVGGDAGGVKRLRPDASFFSRRSEPGGPFY